MEKYYSRRLQASRPAAANKDLRILAGMNEAVVQQLAGDASITTTLKYYTSILPQALRSAQARLPFGAVLRDVSDTYHATPKLAREKTA